MNKWTVEQVFRRHPLAHEVIDGSMPVRELIQLFASRPSVLAAFIADDNGRYQGSVSRIELLRWVALRTGGSPSRSLGMGTVRRLVVATNASDLSRGVNLPAVTPGTTLDEALTMMLQANEVILPVLDSGGRIIGDLRVSEILEASLEMEDPGSVD